MPGRWEHFEMELDLGVWQHGIKEDVIAFKVSVDNAKLMGTSDTAKSMEEYSFGEGKREASFIHSAQGINIST
jgi:hypothetical protein